jgi:hypothetical protein
MVVRFNLSEDRTSMPNIEAVVAGKIPKVVTGPNTYTREYSLNPADQLFEYLTDPIAGAGLDPDLDIDKESFKTVADWLNVEDTSYEKSYIKYWRYLGWPTYDYPKARARMQCNTLVSTEDPVTKNVEEILKQFNGSLNVVGGKYFLSLEKEAPAVADITMSEVIGRVSIKDTPNKDKWNSIQAGIIDPALDWGVTQISFFNSSFLASDKGIRKKGNVGFSNITNYYTARSKAEKALKDSRFNRTLSFTTYYKFCFLKPNDIVTFTYPRFGYAMSKFRVRSVEVQENGLVQLVLVQYDTTTDQPSTQAPAPTPADTTGTSVAPTNLSFRVLPDPSVAISTIPTNTYGILFWEAPTISESIMRYNISIYPEGSPSNQVLGEAAVGTQVLVNGNLRNYFLVPLIAGSTSYVFKVQTVLSNGDRSPFAILVHSTPALVEPAYIPPIQQFRVTNIGIDGTFVGPNVSFAWEVSATTGVAGYILEVKDSLSGSTILTASGIPKVSSSYTLTLAQNKAGYAMNNAGALGAYRSITARIRAVTHGGRLSDWSNL